MIKKILSKKYTILTIITVVSLLFIFMQINKGKKVGVQNTPLPLVTSRFQSLTLGESSRNDVVREIGAPQNEYITDNKQFVEYTTKNPNFNDQFIIEDDRLSFVRKILILEDTTKVADIKKQYGDAELILYGPGSSIGIYLYVYPSKGIAYLGHEKSGYITEIWYFKSTSIEDFIGKFAKEYSQDLEATQ